MTPEHRLTLISETIRALQIGTPVSKGLVTLLLDPWPDLYRDALMMIPTEVGHGFRFEAGHCSGMKPASIPE